MQGRILVVEDEADLGELLAFNLRQAGFEVVVAGDGAQAIQEASVGNFDLMLLDIMLPDILGTDVCRQVRKDPATEAMPVIMLTAKGEEVDRVVGFELGADDYITKPFSPRELVLRVGAVLRRAKGAASEAPPAKKSQVQAGDITIDVDRHEVRIAGAQVPLTALEFRLLVDLASRRGRVQSRDVLLERVWGYVAGVGSRTVDTHVKRLREKLGPSGDCIETVRGVGYRMRD